MWKFLDLAEVLKGFTKYFLVSKHCLVFSLYLAPEGLVASSSADAVGSSFTDSVVGIQLQVSKSLQGSS